MADASGETIPGFTVEVHQVITTATTVNRSLMYGGELFSYLSHDVLVSPADEMTAPSAVEESDLQFVLGNCNAMVGKAERDIETEEGRAAGRRLSQHLIGNTLGIGIGVACVASGVQLEGIGQAVSYILSGVSVTGGFFVGRRWAGRMDAVTRARADLLRANELQPAQERLELVKEALAALTVQPAMEADNV